jgi:hypothetical protein
LFDVELGTYEPYLPDDEIMAALSAAVRLLVSEHATVCAGLRRSWRSSICHRLRPVQPRGSIKASYVVVCCGYGTGISVVAVLLVAARAI